MEGLCSLFFMFQITILFSFFSFSFLDKTQKQVARLTDLYEKTLQQYCGIKTQITNNNPSLGKHNRSKSIQPYK